MRILALLQKRPNGRGKRDYLALFLQSREAMGVSPKTLRYYRERLSKLFRTVDVPYATRQDIQQYLNTIPPNKYGLGNRHASYRAIKALYKWLNREYGMPNPMEGMPAPILGKPILPSLDKEEVLFLIEKAPSIRDKAAISLFVESGLRLSEHAGVKQNHINWSNRTIRILGKGRKEAYAAFGDLTEKYLKAWLHEYHPDSGNVWGLSEWGIASMLRRLEKETGINCNAHSLRRTFACLLRKAGVDTMTIKDLGRWESLEMVQRYTRAVSFDDSLKFYPPSLLNNKD